MLTKNYPEEGDLVVGTVLKVQGFGAFVSLDEYPNKEGFIHISEISTGWVKRIRNYIREKQKVVCKVLRVDQAKNHIDLSLKRVNDHQRRDKIQEWKNSQKASKLFEMVANALGKPVNQCYQEFGQDLTTTYGTLFEAFEEAAYDSESLPKEGFKGEWVNEFIKIAKDNISIPFVTIKGQMNITSWRSDAIKYIKEALILAEKGEYEDVEIVVKYLGAPRYLISVRAPDYKIAEEQMKKAVDRATEYISNYDGQCIFKREIEE